jgi:hypothetical protein
MRGGSLLRLPLAACAVGAIACLGLIGSSAHAAHRSGHVPRSFFGVVPITAISVHDARLMAKGGIGSARISLNWAIAQNSQGAYQWAPFDSAISALASRRIRIVATLQGMPGWLESNPYAVPRTRRERRAWNAFIRAAVRRFGPHGRFWAEHPKLPYDPIRAWQVWNEENHYFGGLPTKGRARRYLGLLRMTAKAIRSTEPSTTIVLGGLGPGLALKSQVPYNRFLNQLYRLHAQRWFDVVDDHPYAAGFKSSMTQIRRTAAVMRRHHDHGSPLWLTEFGWASNRPKGYRDAGLGKGPRGQARILGRSYRYLIAQRRNLNLGRVYWFSWADPKHSQLPEGLAFGLRRHDLSPKPAWRTFERFAR